MKKADRIRIPAPTMQIDFSFALGQMRELYLQDAIGKTLARINLSDLNNELSKFVPEDDLKILARHGLRGELVFPAPLLLLENPRLLGYYRLLLGFSQKEFYSGEFGIAKYKPMETKGIIPKSVEKSDISAICLALIGSLSKLMDGIGVNRITAALLDDLTLLTVGPQLRGGANVKKGQAGIIDVFKAIHDITEKDSISSKPGRIEVKNASGRRVVIEFSPDPDIVIREELPQNEWRNIVAIEIKGGTDFSNIHNRIGEAEKTKADGFIECWTVVNVDRFNKEMAEKESPATNKFYRLSSLVSKKGTEYLDFKNQLSSRIGIQTK